MSAKLPTRTGDSDRRSPPSFRTWIGTIAIACALVPSACSHAPPSASVGPDPADPRAAVPPAAYRSTTAGYVRQRPVEPRPWTEQNQRVAPAERP
jgi:hypothetical protein